MLKTIKKLKLLIDASTIKWHISPRKYFCAIKISHVSFKQKWIREVMSAMELLCQIIGIEPHNISKEENIIIEAELFTRVCEALKDIFKSQYKDYFRLMKFNLEMENIMLEENFIRCVINDIVSTEEYSLSGIAYYTQTPEDVIYDLASGRNVCPSLPLSRKIINLHRTIRPSLYRNILKKIASEYLI